MKVYSIEEINRAWTKYNQSVILISKDGKIEPREMENYFKRIDFISFLISFYDEQK